MKKKFISVILLTVLCFTAVLSCAACLDFDTPTLPPSSEDTGNANNPADNVESDKGDSTAPPQNEGEDNENQTVNPPDNTEDGDKAPDTGVINPPSGNENTGKPDGDKNDTENNDKDEPFEDYGMNVITVELSRWNVNENGIYNTMEEVGAYIHLYNNLPQNYTDNLSKVKNEHTAKNKLSYGGATFYNREGLLPKANGRTFTECDIGYTGKNRNALRIVFSSDGLIFYTSDHYGSFSILRFV